MRRTIQNKVENSLADSILGNKIKKGNKKTRKELLEERLLVFLQR